MTAAGPAPRPDILRYTAIVTGPDGGSRFADADLALTAREIAPGVPPMRVGGLPSAAGVAYVRSEFFDSAPHPAPARQWVVMLRGTIEVTTTDGARRRFGPGDPVLAVDVDGAGHSTAAVGEPPFEALFIPADSGVDS
ncbi:cupin domain-containing protein [Nocardia aurantia]|uniref:Cupin domain-containing protein n=1 Tax=Nocardia aurantia TaxID=2585199 RepID=A0A7K0E0V7_9NOCA|nr:hypothetical protein [Nocardia aurantia]MQY31703.1 hypothetical protein [Nocardia aurantia]